VHPDQAKELISQTENEVGRARDLKILAGIREAEINIRAAVGLANRLDWLEEQADSLGSPASSTLKSQARLWLAAYELAYQFKSGCGAGDDGDPGFQPGNTCAGGGGAAVAEDDGDSSAVDEGVLAWARDKFGDDTKAESFARWFGNSLAVDENNEPKVLYHGTTHGFQEFTYERANPENAYGAGFYFTDNPDDAAHNYADPETAPDLTIRIESLAERIQQEYEDERGEEVGTDWAREEAAKQLAGQSPNLMPVYLSLQYPLDLREGVSEKFEYEVEYDDYNPNEGLDEDDDDYDPDFMPEEIGVTGNGARFIEALDRVAAKYEDVNETPSAAIQEHLYDRITESGAEWREVLDFLQKGENSPIIYATDDEGKFVSTQIIREALEEAGFDGVIHDASQFSNMKHAHGTTHYIAFKPEQVKSATGNSGAFDSADPDITKQLDRVLAWVKNCGSGDDGSPGFQPGNTCGSGDGAGASLGDEDQGATATVTGDPLFLSGLGTSHYSEAVKNLAGDLNDVFGEFLDNLEDNERNALHAYTGTHSSIMSTSVIGGRDHTSDEVATAVEEPEVPYADDENEPEEPDDEPDPDDFENMPQGEDAAEWNKLLGLENPARDVSSIVVGVTEENLTEKVTPHEPEPPPVHDPRQMAWDFADTTAQPPQPPAPPSDASELEAYEQEYREWSDAYPSWADYWRRKQQYDALLEFAKVHDEYVEHYNEWVVEHDEWETNKEAWDEYREATDENGNGGPINDDAAAGWLRHAINDAPELPEPIEVFHGVDAKQHRHVLEQLEAKLTEVGTKVKLAGFASSSIAWDQAMGFITAKEQNDQPGKQVGLHVDDARRVMFSIKAKQGALWVDPVSQNSGERELILSPDNEYFYRGFTDLTQDGYDYRVYSLEQDDGSGEFTRLDTAALHASFRKFLRHLAWLKNCGSGSQGSPGFQPGNTCAGGGAATAEGGGGSADEAMEYDQQIDQTENYPFLKDVPEHQRGFLSIEELDGISLLPEDEQATAAREIAQGNYDKHAAGGEAEEPAVSDQPVDEDAITLPASGGEPLSVDGASQPGNLVEQYPWLGMVKPEYHALLTPENLEAIDKLPEHAQATEAMSTALLNKYGDQDAQAEIAQKVDTELEKYPWLESLPDGMREHLTPNDMAHVDTFPEDQREAWALKIAVDNQTTETVKLSASNSETGDEPVKLSQPEPTWMQGVSDEVAYSLTDADVETINGKTDLDDAGKAALALELAKDNVNTGEPEYERPAWVSQSLPISVLDKLNDADIQKIDAQFDNLQDKLQAAKAIAEGKQGVVDAAAGKTPGVGNWDEGGGKLPEPVASADDIHYGPESTGPDPLMSEIGDGGMTFSDLEAAELDKPYVHPAFAETGPAKIADPETFARISGTYEENKRAIESLHEEFEEIHDQWKSKIDSTQQRAIEAYTGSGSEIMSAEIRGEGYDYDRPGKPDEPETTYDYEADEPEEPEEIDFDSHVEDPDFHDQDAALGKLGLDGHNDLIYKDKFDEAQEKWQDLEEPVAPGEPGINDKPPQLPPVHEQTPDRMQAYREKWELFEKTNPTWAQYWKEKEDYDELDKLISSADEYHTEYATWREEHDEWESDHDTWENDQQAWEDYQSEVSAWEDEGGEATELAEPLRDALNSAPDLPQPTTVYHGVENSQFEHIMEQIDDKLEPGDLVDFAGFVSTSLDPNRAKNFGGVSEDVNEYRAQVLLSVKAKSGAGYVDHGLTSVSGERELILSPDNQYRYRGFTDTDIPNDEGDPVTYRLYHFEQVSGEEDDEWQPLLKTVDTSAEDQLMLPDEEGWKRAVALLKETTAWLREQVIWTG
jgi:hypothetical protein